MSASCYLLKQFIVNTIGWHLRSRELYTGLREHVSLALERCLRDPSSSEEKRLKFLDSRPMLTQKGK